MTGEHRRCDPVLVTARRLASRTDDVTFVSFYFFISHPSSIHPSPSHHPAADPGGTGQKHSRRVCDRGTVHRRRWKPGHQKSNPPPQSSISLIRHSSQLPLSLLFPPHTSQLPLCFTPCTTYKPQTTVEALIMACVSNINALLRRGEVCSTATSFL